MAPSYPAGSYPAKVVADGAVAYWRLGETSGTTAVDVISGVNGTISGGVTLGQAGALADGDKAMAFDGTSGQIVTSAVSWPATAFTIECWANAPVSALGNYRSIYGNRTGASLPGTFAADINPTGEFECWMNGAGATVFPGNRADGLFHHVVYVNDGTNGRLYIDNVAGSATAQAHVVRTVPFQIGTALEAGGTAWLGIIDEVAIYPTALTAPQIAAHYAAKSWTALPDIRWRWCRYVQRPARQVRR